MRQAVDKYGPEKYMPRDGGHFARDLARSANWLYSKRPLLYSLLRIPFVLLTFAPELSN